MPRQSITPVEPLRIDPIQAPHSAGKVRLGRFQQKVVVVAHQAIGIEQPVLLSDLPPQQTEETLPILVIEEDRLAPIAPGSHVVHSSRKL
jgi:hypothetical protein